MLMYFERIIPNRITPIYIIKAHLNTIRDEKTKKIYSTDILYFCLFL